MIHLIFSNLVIILVTFIHLFFPVIKGIISGYKNYDLLYMTIPSGVVLGIISFIFFNSMAAFTKKIYLTLVLTTSYMILITFWLWTGGYEILQSLL